MTLFNPQIYSDFTLDQKFRNMFTEDFLVQIHQKFQEISSEICVQAKKFEKRVPKFKTRRKKEIRGGGGKRWGGLDENQSKKWTCLYNFFI
jgi:hypothetical protein